MTRFCSAVTLTVCLTVLGNILSVQSTIAQIIPDNSLGTESSIIRQDTIKNLPSDVIEGGASRGSNLFHSFREFNVNEGRGAYFANPAVIQNIFSRVTGGNISHILGTLGVLGNANLFLINPNGIIFGANARLDMRGAFVGSTADSVIFDNGFEFSASNPDAPPLLTVNIPLGIRFRENAGDITSNANLSTPSDLTLQGGNINLTGSVVAGGELSLEALETVTIRDTIETPFFAVSGQDLLIQGSNIDIFALNHPQSAIASYGNLTLKSPNRVLGDAHYYSGGNFRIEQFDGSLGELYSPNDPVIRTLGDVTFSGYQGASLHIIAGGSVTIDTIVITGTDTTSNTINPISTPNLANFRLSDGTPIEINGSARPTLDIRAGVSSNAIFGDFVTGSIFVLDAFDFNLSGNFVINPFNFPPNPSGSAITIGDIIFVPPSGQILLTNQYQPNLSLPAGDITLTNNGFFGDGIDARGFGGDGSDVIFDARSGINVNSNIDASSDIGNGGDVTILANGDVTIGSNIRVNGLEGGNVSVVTPADILINNGASLDVRAGGGGNITLEARQIELTEGSSIRAGIGENRGALGAQAGNIEINATERVTIIDNQFFSEISNNVSPNAIGNAGNTTITTKILEGIGNFVIGSATFGEGDAGDVKITATEQISLMGGFGSGISSAVSPNAMGNGANIIIETPILSLTNFAQLATSTLGNGNAGNIEIRATESLSLNQNSVLQAISFSQGNAGNITINAEEATVSLDNFSAISTSIGAEQGFIGTGQGGDIHITAASLTLSNSSQIFTSTAGTGARGIAGNIEIDVNNKLEISNFSSISSILGSNAIGRGGNIDITAGSLTLDNGVTILASTSGTGESNTDLTGNAGNINLTVARNATLARDSGIASNVESGGVGNAGNINFSADSLSVTGGSGITSFVREVTLNPNGTINPFGQGNGGDIIIQANDINVEGFSSQNPSQINTSVGTGARGRAGNIRIEADNNLTLSDFAFIGSTLNFNAIGRGGNIDINTGSLTLDNGGVILASTFGTGEPHTDLTGNAGNINFTVARNATLTRNSGIQSNVESGGVGNAGNVNFSADSLSVTGGSAITSFVREATFNPNGTINPSGQGNGGDIIIKANDINVEGFSSQNPSQINTSVGFGARGRAGNITIEADNNLTLSNFAFIGSTLDSNAIGRGGNIDITAGSLSLSNGGVLTSSTSGIGNAGNIDISVDEAITLDNNQTRESAILSSVGLGGIGEGGDINIQARSLTLKNGSQINSSLFRADLGFSGGIGQGGDIQIQTSDFIDISGFSSQGFSSGLFASTERGAKGSGGTITVDTNTFRIADGAVVNVFTANSGNGGNIILNANTFEATGGGQVIATTRSSGNAGTITLNITDNILISGNDPTFANRFAQFGEDIVNNQGQFSGLYANTTQNASGQGGSITLNSRQIQLQAQSQISSDTQGIGNAGTITITSDTLDLTGNSILQTNTSNTGDAGDINLIIQDRLALTQSAIEATTTPNSSGNGGDIIIDPELVSLSDESRIAVNSQGTGNGGNIFLTATNLTLNNNSTISATTASGEGGNITLNIADTLRQRNNSDISATAGGTGNGGNITINTRYLIGSGDSDITANAFEGNGGNIRITAQGIFRDLRSEITASSELGVDGIVDTNTPDVDPSRGLVNLPQNIVDPNALIAQNACRKGNQSEFTVAGRGGLPNSPEQVQGSDKVSVELIEPTEDLDSDEAIIKPTSTETERKIIPAQGWRKNEKGELVLIADASQNEVNRALSLSGTCSSNSSEK